MTDQPEFEVSFDVNPPYSMEERGGQRSVEWWVIGEGLELPCDDLHSAVSLIAGLMEHPETALTDYLMG